MAILHTMKYIMIYSSAISTLAINDSENKEKLLGGNGVLGRIHMMHACFIFSKYQILRINRGENEEMRKIEHHIARKSYINNTVDTLLQLT